MKKSQAIKKIQIAIDKVIDLSAYEKVSEFNYTRERVLDGLRDIERTLNK